MHPVLDLDAVGQAAAVRSGEISPSELVGAAIARIESLDGDINAVLHPRLETARAEAAGPLPDGPFRGVPLLVKDALCEMAGEPSWAGMGFLARHDHRASTDSHLVRRFRAAGFVILGRTNLPELALRTTTEPVAFGPTRNPLDRERTPGGSSGGSAAAVAAHMVAVAHGNDMGGSIRIPAAWCGLVGLKPTRGRTSIGPAFGEYWGQMTHEHVLCRTVRDTAAVLDVTAGSAPGDPYAAPPPSRPWSDEVGVDPLPQRVLVVDRSPDGSPLGADAQAAMDLTARRLEALGHRVARGAVTPWGDHEVFGGYLTVLAAHVASELDRLSGIVGVEITADDVEEETWGLAQLGRATSAPQLVAATHALHRWSRRCASWWSEEAGIDLLVTPTAPTSAPLLGHVDVSGTVAYTVPVNVTGQPAISLPLHTAADGMPMGVQIVAPTAREDLLVRLGSQLEDAV
ncbi:MAG: amidase [Acidimicrobiales bacterium]